MQGCFRPNPGPFGWLEPAHDNYGLVGSGTFVADGIQVQLSGRRAGLFGSLFPRKEEFAWKSIVNVESAGEVVHFTYRADLAPREPLPSGSLTRLPPSELPRYFQKSEQRIFVRSFSACAIRTTPCRPIICDSSRARFLDQLIKERQREGYSTPRSGELVSVACDTRRYFSGEQSRAPPILAWTNNRNFLNTA